MFHPKLASLVDTWLPEATIEMLQGAMEKGELTSKDLVLMYMHRISQYDKKGPAINAVLELNPDAVHTAEALDLERKNTGARGPLHGIPVLLKDNIDTADMLHTSAGSLALENNFASEDASIVTQLREAGAIILGKTNLTEWANFMTQNMPNGYSSRGGQVLNPYGPGIFDVGGSSSGSGAAIAAGFAAAAIGTETSGSILSPAASNSIVGIKPTVGLLSRKGIIPISFSQDTAGPMTRSVRDAAILLSFLTKTDEKDTATLINPAPGIDYTAYLSTDGLKGKRIGVARDPYFNELPEEEVALMEQALFTLREQGAIIIDPIHLPYANDKWDYNTLIFEFKPALNAYLHRTSPTVPIKSLKDLISYNKDNKKQMLKHEQTVLEECERFSGTLTEAAYIHSREKDIYRTREDGIDRIMADHQLDAILTPHYYGCAIPAKAGYPSITVPAGYTAENKPLAVTFTARAFEESTLIQIAYGYEQATEHRKAPVFKTKGVQV